MKKREKFRMIVPLEVGVVDNDVGSRQIQKF
jgi:hypothetical protein